MMNENKIYTVVPASGNKMNIINANNMFLFI